MLGFLKLSVLASIFILVSALGLIFLCNNFIRFRKNRYYDSRLKLYWAGAIVITIGLTFLFTH